MRKHIIDLGLNWRGILVCGVVGWVSLNYYLTPDDESPIPHCVLPVRLFVWLTDDALSAQSCI
jgi:hypothetical protein